MPEPTGHPLLRGLARLGARALAGRRAAAPGAGRPLRLERLRARLAALPPPRLPPFLAPVRAAVAIVLREGPRGVEALLIERARRPRDPWSGHMAFPGGRAAPEDLSPTATAERETLEETGLDLARLARPLGALAYVQARAHGRPLPMAIAPVVFELGGAEAPLFRLKLDEVVGCLWVPLDALRSGAHDDRMTWRRLFGVVPIRLRCWRYEGKVIWGLTHRMLEGLLRVDDEE